MERNCNVGKMKWLDNVSNFFFQSISSPWTFKIAMFTWIIIIKDIFDQMDYQVAKHDQLNNNKGNTIDLTMLLIL